jgi:hypothetical protein
MLETNLSVINPAHPPLLLCVNCRLARLPTRWQVFRNSKGQKICAGFIYHEDSLKAAYIIDMLYRGDGRDAPNLLDGAKVGRECGDCRCVCACTGTSSCDGSLAGPRVNGSWASAEQVPSGCMDTS